jgi:murein DD-endopeptidase MepM/ murein hydrolase activator NlpD
MNRILLLLAILLAAKSSLADPQHYPFKLAFSAEPNGQVVMAQNDGPAPILATVKLLNPDNAIVDHPSPIVLVVKPKESMPIATVRRAVAGKDYRVSTSYKFSIGDPDALHDPAATYRLPFQDGQSIIIGQVSGGRITTHNAPDSQYAIDFSIPIGTSVLAARKGRVADIDQHFTKGGRDPSLKANHVLILHEDGTLGLYSHFSANRITVSIGQWIDAGTLIGYSGNTGYSTGPHLHFAVLTNTRTPDGAAKYISVPVTFVNDAPERAIQLFQDVKLVANYSGR